VFSHKSKQQGETYWYGSSTSIIIIISSGWFTWQQKADKFALHKMPPNNL
jgi:hypothetical protein